tara:strand:- start:358 stop:489 length:132 start_codon:yes stop_codon:yes gene_type:complete
MADDDKSQNWWQRLLLPEKLMFIAFMLAIAYYTFRTFGVALDK